MNKEKLKELRNTAENYISQPNDEFWYDNPSAAAETILNLYENIRDLIDELNQCKEIV